MNKTGSCAGILFLLPAHHSCPAVACWCAAACLNVCLCFFLLSLQQVADITAAHDAAVLQLENNHTLAIAVLQDEHDCEIRGKQFVLHTAFMPGGPQGLGSAYSI